MKMGNENEGAEKRKAASGTPRYDAGGDRRLIHIGTQAGRDGDAKLGRSWRWHRRLKRKPHVLGADDGKFRLHGHAQIQDFRSYATEVQLAQAGLHSSLLLAVLMFIHLLAKVTGVLAIEGLRHR